MFEALTDSALKGKLILRSQMGSKKMLILLFVSVSLERIKPSSVELFSCSLIYANYDGNLT